MSSVDIKTGGEGHTITIRRKTSAGSEWTITGPDRHGFIEATAGIHDDAYGPLRIVAQDIAAFLADLRLASGKVG